MARFKLGFGMADIRGKIGNYVYSIQKTGVSTIRQVAQAVSNPMSPDQAAIRCSLAQLSKDWSDTLVQAERDAWSTWALTKPGMGNKDGGILTVIKGNNGIMSGFNAYVLANQWLKSINVASTKVAPLGATPPTPPLTVAVSYALGVATITWVKPVTAKADAMCRIWLACHQPGIHRQMCSFAAYDDETYDLSGAKGAQGAFVLLPAAPGDYIVQMDTVDPDGTKSGPSNIAEFKVV